MYLKFVYILDIQEEILNVQSGGSVHSSEDKEKNLGVVGNIKAI